jgi:hypothetical protein
MRYRVLLKFKNLFYIFIFYIRKQDFNVSEDQMLEQALSDSERNEQMNF